MPVHLHDHGLFVQKAEYGKNFYGKKLNPMRDKYIQGHVFTGEGGRGGDKGRPSVHLDPSHHGLFREGR